MKVVIRRIGNSRGVVIPKPLLAEAGLETEAEMTVEDTALVIRRPSPAPRAGWAEAARKIARANDDISVTGDFANAEDAENTW